MTLLFAEVSNAQVSHATCWNCSGSGRIICGLCGGRGCAYTIMGPTACFACGGCGTLSCPICYGSGKIVYQVQQYNIGGGYNVNTNNTYSTESTTFTETIQNSESKQKARMEEYKNRYGYKDCHLCRGSGICSSCGGSGFQSSMTGGRIPCANCKLDSNGHRTGKCGGCGGTGKVYGLK